MAIFHRFLSPPPRASPHFPYNIHSYTRDIINHSEHWKQGFYTVFFWQTCSPEKWWRLQKALKTPTISTIHPSSTPPLNFPCLITTVPATDSFQSPPTPSKQLFPCLFQISIINIIITTSTRSAEIITPSFNFFLVSQHLGSLRINATTKNHITATPRPTTPQPPAQWRCTRFIHCFHTVRRGLLWTEMPRRHAEPPFPTVLAWLAVGCVDSSRSNRSFPSWRHLCFATLWLSRGPHIFIPPNIGVFIMEYDCATSPHDDRNVLSPSRASALPTSLHDHLCSTFGHNPPRPK